MMKLVVSPTEKESKSEIGVRTIFIFIMICLHGLRTDSLITNIILSATVSLFFIGLGYIAFIDNEKGWGYFAIFCAIIFFVIKVYRDNFI